MSPGVWESTAGLRYGPGSAQGNRVLHVLEHAADIPTRAGAHGVFAGGRSGTLASIDEAYLLGQAGGPGVTVAHQGARTVYTVNMGRPDWNRWRAGRRRARQPRSFSCEASRRGVKSHHRVPGDSMRELMLRIGTCSLCGNGNVGIRVSATGTCIVAMCDECDAVWLDKRMTAGPHFPVQPHLPCPTDGSSLRDPPAHWATRAEADAAGWSDAIIDETDAI